MSPGSPSSRDSNFQESSKNNIHNNGRNIGYNNSHNNSHNNGHNNGRSNGHNNTHNGNSNNKDRGHLDFERNENPEQITPTSSVDTEEGNPAHPEEGERGVEGDAEASDEDHLSKTN